VSEPRIVTVTFLFTDIEGSTRLVKQLRERYPEVLADHRRLLREAFTRHGGEEVDTQGDAFFYVFTRARDAAAAAADGQRALQGHAWPEDGELRVRMGLDTGELRVRMGLHTGEPVVSEEGYHGLGVHRAARIMAAGHGGQILASTTTAAMLDDDALPGVAHRDLGDFRLKDLERLERVYQLDVEGLPTEFPPLRTGDAPTAYEGKEDALVAAAARTRRPLARRPLVIGVVAGILAAAVAVPLYAIGRDSGGATTGLQRVQDNAVGVVDAESREIVGEAPGIASPQRVASGEGAIWVTSPGGGGTVIRLDPQSHDITDTIEVGNGPVGIAVGAGAVWVANTLDGTVSRIDAATHREVDTIPVGNTPTGVAFGAGAVWVTMADDRSVWKIDPVTGKVTRKIDVGALARWIAVGDGAVWVTDSASNALVRIDARSAKVTDRPTVGSGPTAVAYGNGVVWVANSLDGTVSRVDSARAVQTNVGPVGAAPNSIAVATDGIWVTDEVAGTLVKLNRALVKTDTTTLGGRPEAMTLAGGSLWIAVQATGAAHRGGILRLAAERGSIDSLDPARAYAPDAWQLLSVVSDGLVGFKRVGGTDGNTVVPDLASALPTPTDGGRTYTFRLHKGIKFSNGRALTASAVRYSLERIFRSNPDQSYIYAGIVGAPACLKRPARCDLSRGVGSDDRSGIVTIRLRAPDAEFLSKLALPFASVVPVGTPVRDAPVLGTGPYRVAEYTTERHVRLIRNPHFEEWSKAAQPAGIPDEIVHTQAGTAESRFAAVQRGRSDSTSQGIPPDRLREARTRHAAQLHITPRLTTIALMLNTTRRPFSDVRARQAVAYAIDRGSIVDAIGGVDIGAPTCQLLPPNSPGYRLYCPYTANPTPRGAWSGPDLARARSLVAASGTQGMRVDVLGVRDVPNLRVLSIALDATLRRLGYRTTVRLLPIDGKTHFFGTFKTAGTRVEATIYPWIADYPSPSGFMNGVLQCSQAPYACGPAVAAQIRQTFERQTQGSRAANEAWARLDREFVDRAIAVPVFTLNAVDFVSRRVQNYQHHPIFEMLVSQVWVR
jgi:YVTN family beta-propeller protein